MYSTRFEKWGPQFNKNKRAGDGPEATSSIKIPRTRARRDANPQQKKSDFQFCDIQPRLASSVRLSEGHTEQRAVMNFAEVYVYGLFDTFSFSSNLFDIIVPAGTPDHSMDWQLIGDECFGAVTLLAEGNHLESRRTFYILCERLRMIVGSNDWAMIIKLWPIFIRLYNTGLLLGDFSLLARFLHFFQRLALGAYPQNHPIPNLLNVLCRTPVKDFLNILQTGYLRTIHCLENRLGFGNAVVLSTWSNYMKKCNHQAIPADALTSRYHHVLEEAESSFTPTATRTIEILHGYLYAAYYNNNDSALTWDLSLKMVNLADSPELMGYRPEWCLATQGYAMAAKLLYDLSEDMGQGEAGTTILRSAIARLQQGDRVCRTRALMLNSMLGKSQS
ncbi:Ff.00g086070.m01.CDS01 [Fusarium sp. VM40]|nr:Ff.00g086070.m01.CDS01 [Fusarium sp. VM40]